jgi:hypothetical protein
MWPAYSQDIAGMGFEQRSCHDVVEAKPQDGGKRAQYHDVNNVTMQEFKKPLLVDGYRRLERRRV